MTHTQNHRRYWAAPEGTVAMSSLVSPATGDQLLPSRTGYASNARKRSPRLTCYDTSVVVLLGMGLVGPGTPASPVLLLSLYPSRYPLSMLNRYNTAGIWRRLVPGLETVTLRVRNTIDGVATYRDYTIGHAKGRPTNTGESPMNGAVASGLRSKRWEMWRDALDAVSASTPKPGDIVVDGNGETWQIQRVEVKLFGNFIGLETQEVH